jgi:hypothetical protein
VAGFGSFAGSSEAVDLIHHLPPRAPDCRLTAIELQQRLLSGAIRDQPGSETARSPACVTSKAFGLDGVDTADRPLRAGEFENQERLGG